MADQKKILIIEDESAIVKALSEHLERLGYDVSVALDGEEGLRKMRTVMPDIALLDIVMPKMDGLTMLREAKNDEKIQHIPIVMLTNLSDNKSISDAIEAGSTDFLVKVDYSLADLQEKIERLIE